MATARYLGPRPELTIGQAGVEALSLFTKKPRIGALVFPLGVDIPVPAIVAIGLSAISATAGGPRFAVEVSAEEQRRAGEVLGLAKDWALLEHGFDVGCLAVFDYLGWGPHEIRAIQDGERRVFERPDGSLWRWPVPETTR